MKFGYCVNMIAQDDHGIGYEQLPMLKRVGFDYVELPLAQIMTMGDRAFRTGPLAALDSTHGAQYRANAEAYAAQIDALDQEFHDFFDALPDRTIVFGDRFPLRYFAEEFHLNYYAAFPGCSTQTEPSAATIAFLTDKVKSEHISTVWYIEFSNHLVADAIAEAAGAGTAMFHSCHNVSPEELAGGETYVTLMEGNLERLRERMT